MVAEDDDAAPSLRYVFAHRYMRDAIFQIGVWNRLFGPDGTEYLQGMWSRCARQFPEHERVSAEGLRLGAVEHEADWVALPIIFPRPQKWLEAYYAAIALRQGRRRRFFGREAPTVRYFTLERGKEEPPLQGAHTVLCEWTTVAHISHGFGTREDPLEFMSCVKKLIML